MLNRKKTQKENIKENKTKVHDAASESYNELLGICFDGYYDLSNARRESMGYKFDPANLTLEGYNYEK